MRGVVIVVAGSELGRRKFHTFLFASFFFVFQLEVVGETGFSLPQLE